jgi:hypothetical protein
MTILLIFWVCASMVVCLALLSVAARQIPRIDELMAAGAGPASGREAAVVLGQVKSACPPSGSKLPAPPLHAQTEKSIRVQPDDPLPSVPSIPVLDPGMGRSCACPRWRGRDLENHPVEVRAPGEITGARSVAQDPLPEAVC